MTDEIKVEPAPIFQKGGLSVERRERDDVSISVGKIRIRFPQWAFWLAMVLIVLAVTSFTVVELASLKWTGKPLPIRGIVESQNHQYRGTNNWGRTQAVELPK